MQLRAVGEFPGPSGEPPASAGSSAVRPLPSDRPDPPLDARDATRLTARINDALRATNQSVQFEVDAASGKTVVQVVDLETQEVLRQVPSKELLAISESLQRYQGWLLRARA